MTKFPGPSSGLLCSRWSDQSVSIRAGSSALLGLQDPPVSSS